MDGGHVAGASQGGRGEGEVGGASAGGNGADGGVGGGAVASGQPRLRQSSALAGAKGVEWTLTRTDPITTPLLTRTDPITTPLRPHYTCGESPVCVKTTSCGSRLSQSATQITKRGISIQADASARAARALPLK